MTDVCGPGSTPDITSHWGCILGPQHHWIKLSPNLCFSLGLSLWMYSQVPWESGLFSVLRVTKVDVEYSGDNCGARSHHITQHCSEAMWGWEWNQLAPLTSALPFGSPSCCKLVTLKKMFYSRWSKPTLQFCQLTHCKRRNKNQTCTPVLSILARYMDFAARNGLRKREKGEGKV